MNEKRIEQHLVSRVKAQGGRAYKWVSPGHSGVPDRIVILPGGRVLAVECKRPGGKPTRLQELELARLSALGIEAVVVDSIESIDSLMEGPCTS
jgi:Holliday junction resolvase